MAIGMFDSEVRHRKDIRGDSATTGRSRKAGVPWIEVVRRRGTSVEVRRLQAEAESETRSIRGGSSSTRKGEKFGIEGHRKADVPWGIGSNPMTELKDRL